MQNKKELRSQILSKRRKLDNNTITEKSNIIIYKLYQDKYFNQAKNISCYYPFKNEVDLLRLFEIKSKNILFPKVIKGTKELAFYKVTDINDFEKGAFGIMEPKPNLSKYLIQDIELFLVPGIGFSINGERIGYGGGYYDTTLSSMNSKAQMYGICFELQIAEPGFADHWDKTMNQIFTESKSYFIKK